MTGQVPEMKISGTCFVELFILKEQIRIKIKIEKRSHRRAMASDILIHTMIGSNPVENKNHQATERESLLFA